MKEFEQLAEVLEQAAKQLDELKKRIKQMQRIYVDEWQLQAKRELAEFGRSRLARFGKTHTEKQWAKPRPYWFRTRSFCVRTAYG